MKKQLMVVDDSRMMELQICKLLEGTEIGRASCRERVFILV